MSRATTNKRIATRTARSDADTQRPATDNDTRTPNVDATPTPTAVARSPSPPVQQITRPRLPRKAKEQKVATGAAPAPPVARRAAPSNKGKGKAKKERDVDAPLLPTRKSESKAKSSLEEKASAINEPLRNLHSDYPTERGDTKLNNGNEAHSVFSLALEQQAPAPLSLLSKILARLEDLERWRATMDARLSEERSGCAHCARQHQAVLQHITNATEEVAQVMETVSPTRGVGQRKRKCEEDEERQGRGQRGRQNTPEFVQGTSARPLGPHCPDLPHFKRRRSSAGTRSGDLGRYTLAPIHVSEGHQMPRRSDTIAESTQPALRSEVRLPPLREAVGESAFLSQAPVMHEGHNMHESQSEEDTVSLETFQRLWQVRETTSSNTSGIRSNKPRRERDAQEIHQTHWTIASYEDDEGAPYESEVTEYLGPLRIGPSISRGMEGFEGSLVGRVYPEPNSDRRMEVHRGFERVFYPPEDENSAEQVRRRKQVNSQCTRFGL